MRWVALLDNRISLIEVDEFVRDMAIMAVEEKEPVYSSCPVSSILIEDLA